MISSFVWPQTAELEAVNSTLFNEALFIFSKIHRVLPLRQRNVFSRRSCSFWANLKSDIKPVNTIKRVQFAKSKSGFWGILSLCFCCHGCCLHVCFVVVVVFFKNPFSIYYFKALFTLYRVTLFREDTKLSGTLWTPIRYVTLHFRDRRAAQQFAPSQKSRRQSHFRVWTEGLSGIDFRGGVNAIHYNVNIA